jgi:hypothetical protein
MQDELSLVYTGSRVEGLFLEELLKDSGIGCMRKDVLEESVSAGWAQGSPEDAVRIFVETSNYEKAKKILDDYFASRDKKKK